MMSPSRLILSCTSVFLLTAGLAVGGQNAQTPPASDDHANFPPGEGRELTLKICSTCHSVDLLAEQTLSEDDWRNTVDQMASMGADATEDQLKQIVAYLAKAFPPPEAK